MLCQVSTSSIRVKLKHQWDQRSGFDCSSPVPTHPSSGGQLLHAAPFHGADKTYCSGDYSPGLYASARTFQGLSESGRTYLSALKPRYSSPPQALHLTL